MLYKLQDVIQKCVAHDAITSGFIFILRAESTWELKTQLDVYVATRESNTRLPD